MENTGMESISWDDARNSLNRIAPKFVKLIDQWNPNFKLYRARYNYGDKVLKSGVLHLGSKNSHSIPISSPKISQDIKNQLSYSNVPLGFITHGSNEVYLETEERVIPLAYFKPGVILGLWESLETGQSYFPRRVWDVTSGARTIFILPSISQRNPHEQLKKKYGVRNSVPNTIYQQNAIFKQIIDSRNFKQEWYNEMIFFGKDWLQRDEKNPHWLRFHHYLLEQAWELSAYNRNKITFDKLWLSFGKHLETKGIKINFPLLNILKQIVAIGIGASPGFRPVVNSETPGPVKEIQKVYLNTYGLKHYIPTVMSVDYFKPYEKNHPIYFSLQAQTQIETRYKIKNILSELRELKTITEIFINTTLKGSLLAEETPLDWLVKNVAFDFFHPDATKHDSITNSKYMPTQDKNLIEVRGAKRGRKFSSACSFVTGCIRLSILSIPRKLAD